MSFKAVLGHEGVQERFVRALENHKLHHAWLLHGMKGTGKATQAAAMAAFYLCKNPGTDGFACGECHACCMLQAGSHPDYFSVKRLEKKRDISVEQIREMLSFLSLSGMESEKRVVLVDDAESMNLQASNALLKGLEEPSAGSLLLIVSHDLMRLPATIRSRCILAHCAPLSDSQMNHVLANMDFSDSAREMAISLAGGRPGHVACLQDISVFNGLAQWRDLLKNVEHADVGKLQIWLDTHLNTIPHALIVDIVLQETQTQLNDVKTFALRENLLKTMWLIAAWPTDVIRHSLRAGPALMGLILELRAILKYS